jgi:cobalt-zinc-cadmium efflux system membrane fusion protein
MRQTLLLMLGLALCAGCGSEPAVSADQHEEHGEEHGDEHAEGSVVRLTPEQREAAGITVVEAGPASIDSGVALLGEIRPNGDRLAHIVPRFPGIVREVRKNVGDLVRPGDVLAVVESSESLSRYDIKTLIEGVVLDKHVTLGEAVDRDKQTFVIADLRTVWVELSIYQKDLSAVRVGQPVRIFTSSEDAGAEGSISYVTPSVDPLTRTATARVVLANDDGRWRPGMFVKARAVSTSVASLSVPSTALQRMEGETVVFVETDAGFEPRPVQLGREGDQLVEVLTGLSAGERVASRNAFLLKAELGKSEAAHEH